MPIIKLQNKGNQPSGQDTALTIVSVVVRVPATYVGVYFILQSLSEDNFHHFKM